MARRHRIHHGDTLARTLRSLSPAPLPSPGSQIRYAICCPGSGPLEPPGPPQALSGMGSETPASSVRSWIIDKTGGLVVLVAKSCLTLATPWTVACQAPLSMEFSRQEPCSGLPVPPPGDLPDPGIEPKSPAWQANSLPPSHLGSPLEDLLKQYCPRQFKRREDMRSGKKCPCIYETGAGRGGYGMGGRHPMKAPGTGVPLTHPCIPGGGSRRGECCIFRKDRS